MFNFFTKSNNKSTKSTKSTTITSSRTSSRVETLEHEWTIDNLSLLHTEKGKFISSTKFSPPDHPNIEFHLKLYPNGDGWNDIKGFVSLFLASNIDQDFILYFKINIKNPLVLSRSCTAKFGSLINHAETDKFSPSKSWGWGCFVPKLLLSPWKIGKLINVNNGPVVVQCKIRYVTDVKTFDI